MNIVNVDNQLSNDEVKANHIPDMCIKTKVEYIHKFSVPTDKKQLMHFNMVWLVNTDDFVHFSDIAAPLTKLLFKN